MAERIETSEGPARAELLAHLGSLVLYRGEGHAHDEGSLVDEAAEEDRDEEDVEEEEELEEEELEEEDERSDIDGRVVGIVELGSDARVERTVTFFGEHAYLQLGLGAEGPFAALFPYETYGGLERRCPDCVLSDGEHLAVRGAFQTEGADALTVDVSADRTSWSALDDADRALVVQGLLHMSFLEPYGLAEEAVPTFVGSALVYEASASSSLPVAGPDTHGCADVVTYDVERRIDLLGGPSESRVLRITGHVEQCCPRDASGVPCAPGPRCTFRDLGVTE